MITSHKTTFYKSGPPVSKETIGGLRENLPKQIFRGRAFKQTQPHTHSEEKQICGCTKMVSEEPINDEIHQIKTGIEYKSDKTTEYLHKGNFSIYVNMLVSCHWSKHDQEKKNIEYLWCCIWFEDKNHIYWYISKDNIRAEYHVPNFNEMCKEGYTVDYIFPTFHRHKNQQTIANAQISVECDGNIVNIENSNELDEIFELGNQILDILGKMDVTDETVPVDIDTFIKKQSVLEHMQKLESFLRNGDLVSSSLFDIIKKIDYRFK